MSTAKYLGPQTLFDNSSVRYALWPGLKARPISALDRNIEDKIPWKLTRNSTHMYVTSILDGRRAEYITSLSLIFYLCQNQWHKK